LYFFCSHFLSFFLKKNCAQAQSRCHRIGQTKVVKVFRLVTRGTYEQTMIDRSAQKLGLSRALLSAADKRNQKSKQTAADIERLLRYGAYQILKSADADPAKADGNGTAEADDETSRLFCEKDIDQILTQDSRVIRYNDEFDESTHNATIGKATFSIETESANVRLDDPNFWEKVMPFISPIGRLARNLRMKENFATRTFFAELCNVVEQHIAATLRGDRVGVYFFIL
jgi:hypothetical protein